MIRGMPARKMLLSCYQPRTSGLYSMPSIFMMWSRGGGRGRVFFPLVFENLRLE